MKKLLLQMNMSTDGFVADSKSKLDWMIQETDQKQIKFLNELTNRSGTIVLGRKMALESIPHWEKVAQNQEENEEVKYAQFFVKAPKVVFSKTIQAIKGKNVIIENGNLVQKINAIKSTSEKDIIVYGGAGFVMSLIENKLIDELNLFIHPVSLGDGLSIFNKKFELQLTKSESYNNGIVLNQYTM